MQIQEPLLSDKADTNIISNAIFDIWIDNRKLKLQKNNDVVKIRSMEINMIDIIGLKSKQKKENGSKVYMLYSYARQKKCLKSERRYLQSIKFQIIEPSEQQRIQDYLIPQIYKRSKQQSKKILICYNPNAGSNSQKHLSQIRQFLSYTNLTYEIFQTQHRNHCLEKLTQLRKDNQQSQYTAVAIVSGDGLMHEYVNSFSNIPVTHVPAGSGNAFAKTQMSEANQLCKDWESIYLVVKNRLKQFNIVKYDLQKLEAPIYSFLSLSWGIISDLDINSEFMRFLGGFRFEVYAVWRIIKMLRYRGRLTFSTIKSQMPLFTENLEQNPDYQTINEIFLHTIFTLIPYISDKYKIAPLISGSEKCIDLQFLTENGGRSQLAKYLLKSDSGAHFDLQNQVPAAGLAFKHEKIKSFRLEPLNPNEMGVFSIDGQAYQSQKIQGSLEDKTFRAFV